MEFEALSMDMDNYLEPTGTCGKLKLPIDSLLLRIGVLFGHGYS
jgi:hypothetical protein